MKTVSSYGPIILFSDLNAKRYPKIFVGQKNTKCNSKF